MKKPAHSTKKKSGNRKHKPAPKLTPTKTYVILSDIQVPWQDKRALGLALDFVDAIRPHGVILDGDIADCYSLSTFSKDPLSEAGLDREIEECGQIMARLAESVSDLEWIAGNHESRLKRTIWETPQFARIKALQFPALFKLKDYGFRWKEYGEVTRLGKLIVTHGSLVRQHSGASSKAHFEKYGSSVLHGHTHRLGAYYKTNAAGTHVAYENGCLCRLDPEYVQFPDWQSGFSVVHVAPSGLFSVQQIPILNRRTLFYGGQQYAAAA